MLEQREKVVLWTLIAICFAGLLLIVVAASPVRHDYRWEWKDFEAAKDNPVPVLCGFDISERCH